MEHTFEVHFSVFKGNGPDTVEKSVTICYDDVHPDVTEFTLRDMAREDARLDLQSRGLRVISCTGIYPA